MTGKERFDNRANQGLLEKRFVANVLKEEAEAIELEQGKAIQKFQLIKDRFMLQDRHHTLASSSDQFSGMVTLNFRKYLRFHDMKTKGTGKAYPIYNRIIFGHMNEVIKKLRFGFTEEVRQQIAGELTIEISG